MMEDFTYTTGGHPSLLHRRSIGTGGYGNVHEVSPHVSTRWPSFTIFPLDRCVHDSINWHQWRHLQGSCFISLGSDEKLVEHEGRIIKKICEQGAHSNIVAVLKLGELRNTSYYFIDMELCDLNLDDYIHRKIPLSPCDSLPYFISNALPSIKAQQIWNIMRQLASGVNYLHTLNTVHRDLKPTNDRPLR